MTVLTIRSHTRFALRQPVQVCSAGGKPAFGLMIELSAEGCRISGLSGARPEIGQAVEVLLDHAPDPVMDPDAEIAPAQALAGQVRWSNDGVVGVRLDKALTNAELAEVLSHSRGPVEVRRYGS